jgi:hypothetical protein
VPGPVGATGPAGPTGATGPKGDKGDQGIPGEGGGAEILSGSGAPSIAVGEPGDAYIDIDTDTLYGPKLSEGLWPLALVGFPEAPNDGKQYARKSLAWAEVVGGSGGGGAGILNGFGPPPESLGADGEYYVDLTGQDMYGPKGTGIATLLPPQYIIKASTEPQNSQVGTYRLANVYTVLKDGQIVGARWWRDPESLITSRVFYLYDDTTQALLATSLASTEVLEQEGWIEVSFAAPITVVANQRLAIALDEPDHNMFSAEIAPPEYPANVTSVGAAWKTVAGNPLYPISSSGPYSFFIDMLWRPLAPATSVWPMAVPGESGVGGGGIPEAPADGLYYSRRNTTWQPAPIYPEAPTDGKIYGRRNAGWAPPFVQMTQAAYDATVKDPNTLYVVVG